MKQMEACLSQHYTLESKTKSDLLNTYNIKLFSLNTLGCVHKDY